MKNSKSALKNSKEKRNKPALNFCVDHMTLLLSPEMYRTAYCLFRIIFGVKKEDVIYEKRKKWTSEGEEVSMTFAVKIGESSKESSSVIQRSVVAVVQPSEPRNQPSHVRKMLEDHNAGAHWQHIALRTPDLVSFHRHAKERGVNFITPVMKDAEEDLIQVFSGEWYAPGSRPSGMFFEFVQRNPTAALLEKVKTLQREAWFRDKTFLGLYSEKEKEYQSGKVTPFIDHELSLKIDSRLKNLPVWEITESRLEEIEQTMLDYAKQGVKR